MNVKGKNGVHVKQKQRREIHMGETSESKAEVTASTAEEGWTSTTYKGSYV